MDSIFIPLISIFLLVLFSAFFSGSETSLTAVSEAKLHKLKKDGNLRAKLAVKLRDDKDSLIGGILLGNNVVNIGASAFGTSFAISQFGETGVLYATVVMTLLILIFGEVLPKTYAFYNAEKVALFVAPLLNIIIKILSPITAFVQKMVDIVLILFRLEKASDDRAISGQEALRGVIEMHHDLGEVLKRETDMLRGILDLGETEVGEVMTYRKNMFTLDADLPPSQIINKILDCEYSRVPLWRKKPDNIVGVLHVKSLLKELREIGDDIDDLNLLKIAKEPWFIPDTNKCSRQLLQFKQSRNHIAIVVNEYGDVVGLVTLEDILEEIVGDIVDEHDTKVAGIRKLKDGSYKVKGEVTIRDINRKFDWHLPDQEAATLAGFLMNEFEDVPVVGQKIIYKKVEFEILKKDKNQITLVKIKRKVSTKL